MVHRLVLLTVVPMLLSVLLASCKDSNNPPAKSPIAAAANTNQQVFQVKGVVQEVKPERKSVVIKHEAVTSAGTNYMPAMTMPFDVKDTNELRGLQTGDAVSFRMIITDNDGWIEHITKLNVPRQMEQPSRPSVSFVKEPEMLKEGDELPDYHFTNEMGQAVSTGQFKGQALAYTFFFTRCPYPNFCPLMSKNFEEAQAKLLAMPSSPTNWHLFSISFDTEFDSPAVLKDYAARYHYDPAHWDFVTGEWSKILNVAEQVGQYFEHDETGAVRHNLRTVVVDVKGRIQKIFPENKWTSDELVAEMVKAAVAK